MPDKCCNAFVWVNPYHIVYNTAATTTKIIFRMKWMFPYCMWQTKIDTIHVSFTFGLKRRTQWKEPNNILSHFALWTIVVFFSLVSSVYTIHRKPIYYTNWTDECWLSEILIFWVEFLLLVWSFFSRLCSYIYGNRTNFHFIFLVIYAMRIRRRVWVHCTLWVQFCSLRHLLHSMVYGRLYVFVNSFFFCVDVHICRCICVLKVINHGF